MGKKKSTVRSRLEKINWKDELKNCTYAEIARHYGCSIDTVKNVISKQFQIPNKSRFVEDGALLSEDNCGLCSEWMSSEIRLISKTNKNEL